jgi:hypothetical protein
MTPNNTTYGVTMTISREFMVALRQALLMIVDAIERELGISPRTAELRKQGLGD